MIDQNTVAEHLDYDRQSGVFTWRVATNRKIRIGSIAGGPNGAGYVQIFLRGRAYLAHRLAWLYVHGRWPPHELDHVDGNKLNNALSNLREATRRQNHYNRGPSRKNTSGHKGVSWNKAERKWRAQIRLNGKPTSLGSFSNIEDAVRAYQAAAADHHGIFVKA